MKSGLYVSVPLCASVLNNLASWEWPDHSCWQQWAFFQQSPQTAVCMTSHQTRHLRLWNVMADRHIKIPMSLCRQILFIWGLCGRPCDQTSTFLLCYWTYESCISLISRPEPSPYLCFNIKPDWFAKLRTEPYPRPEPMFLLHLSLTISASG